jgi:hypothetical protein
MQNSKTNNKGKRVIDFEKISFLDIIDILESSLDDIATENSGLEDEIEKQLFLRNL